MTVKTMMGIIQTEQVPKFLSSIIDQYTPPSRIWQVKPSEYRRRR